MTHPLTPRERVEKIIRANVRSHGRGGTLSFTGVENCTERILTALASGSGDHAELARWAKDWPYYSCTSEVVESVLALLAEIAALRARNERLMREADETALVGYQATEAERKLAEAVGLKHLTDGQLFAAINAAVTITRDRNGVDNGAVCISPEKFRTFLSKEAERG